MKENIGQVVVCGFQGTEYSEELKTLIEEYKTKDGYKYCFSVPSEMLVLRRNKKIFVTHNCGKTSLVTGIPVHLDTISDISFSVTSSFNRALS